MAWTHLGHIKWTDNNPAIYYDAYYDSYRDGLHMVYKFQISISTVTGSSTFGFPILLTLNLNGTEFLSDYTMKKASPNQWSNNIVYESDWKYVYNKVDGTTPFTVRLRSKDGSSRDQTNNFNLPIISADAPSGIYVDTVEGSITNTSAELEGGYSNIGTGTFQSDLYSWGPTTNYGFSGKNLTGLETNTKYYIRYQVTNSANLTNSASNYFYTLGDIPVIETVSLNVGRDRCIFPTVEGIWYDNNAYYNSSLITYSKVGGSPVPDVPGPTIYNLEPNTIYNYSYTITDNWARTSEAATGSFKTTCNAPTINSVTETKQIEGFQIKINATGDINAPVTNYTIFYKKANSLDDYTELSSLTDTIVITDLDGDTDYEYYVAATNDGGSTVSEIKTISTLMDYPTVVLEVSNLTPFSFTIIANATTEPERILSYQFSKDNGETWTEEQSLNSYTWDNLNEETTYPVAVEVTAHHTSTFGWDVTTYTTLNVETPADQARIRIKTNNGWEKGKMYYKINNTWVKAKKVYIKKDNVWIIGKND